MIYSFAAGRTAVDKPKFLDRPQSFDETKKSVLLVKDILLHRLDELAALGLTA